MAGNTLSMGNFDEFNCLLIGCCIGLANLKSISNSGNSTTFLDDIFTNIEPFFGKSLTIKDVSFVKQEFESVFTLLIDLFNFINDKRSVMDDESLIVRLSMLIDMCRRCQKFDYIEILNE